MRGPAAQSAGTTMSYPRNRYAKWLAAIPRLVGDVWPAVNPSFRLEAGSTIFTIGSCFARNIEEHLRRLGFDVPMLRFSVPHEEWLARPNGILNKFTPAAIFQDVAWAARILVRDGTVTDADCEPFRYDCASGLCIDMNLAGFIPVTRDRFLERRRELYNVLEAALRAEYVVITLGLVEAWRDSRSGLYIDEPPNGRAFAGQRERFVFCRLSYAECRDCLQQTIDVIRRINPAAQFLLTTSPVPLARTYTADDVIVANMYSKSLLRAVVGDVVDSNPFVDYFPSYESAMLTRAPGVWEPDFQHVTDVFVGKVVARLVDAYCSGQQPKGRALLDSHLSWRAGNLDEAVRLAREAVDATPTDPAAHAHLGTVHRDRGQLPEAEAAFRAALRLAPRTAAVHMDLADVLSAQGRLDEAIASAQRGANLAHQNVGYRERLAALCMHRRFIRRAAREWTLARARRWALKFRYLGPHAFGRFVQRKIACASGLVAPDHPEASPISTVSESDTPDL